MLGILVTERARRGDISWTFLGFYLGALAIRVGYLGQRWRVFLRGPSKAANTGSGYRHNSVVHFLASNVRRAMETCPIALAGSAGAGGC